MDKLIRARAELYGHLYKRFMAEDGPWCGQEELEGLYETNRYLPRAMLCARDMGHVKFNRFGGVRLTGSGVLFAEKEYFGEGDGN